jgi:hypothetical protein
VRCREFEGRYHIRFERGEKALDTFHAFPRGAGRRVGLLLRAGCPPRVEFGFYRPARKEWAARYSLAEELEGCSWSGNVADPRT